MLDIIKIIQKNRDLEDDEIMYLLKKMELASNIYSTYDIKTNKHIGEEKLNDQQIIELFLIICKWCEKNNDIAGLSTLLNFKDKKNIKDIKIEKELKSLKKQIMNV